MSEDVLIIGGGIGGLTAAIALARGGHHVRVFEQAQALTEVGAGITLSSGAMRCVEVLGLRDTVHEHSQETVNLPFRHWRSGEILRRGFDAKPRAPTARVSRQIHRADMQALLARQLLALAPDSIVLGRRIVGFEQSGARVTARFADGNVERGSMLVAADGVRSVVRDSICAPQQLSFTGQVAFRCLVPMEQARRVLPDGRGSVFIGPGCTINRYPLRQDTIMNCVGLAKTDVWAEEGWNTRATNAEFLSHFADWHPEVTGLIGAAPQEGIIKWGLFAREPLPRWSVGRVTLLGDAAHPMLPFLGLGAVMAIEDGTILARALDAHADVATALKAYEAARKPRTTSVYDASILQGQLTQAQDPESYGSVASPAHDPAVFDFDPLAVNP